MPDEATTAPVPGEFDNDSLTPQLPSDAAQPVDADESEARQAEAGVGDNDAQDVGVADHEVITDVDSAEEGETGDAALASDPQPEQQAEDDAAPVSAEPAVVVADEAADAAPVDQQAGDATSAAEANDSQAPDQAAAPQVASTPEPAPEADAGPAATVTDAEPEPYVPERVHQPRRRRAASRPAGPPVEVPPPAVVPTTVAAAEAAPAEGEAASTEAAAEPAPKHTPRRRATRSVVFDDGSQQIAALAATAPDATAPVTTDAVAENAEPAVETTASVATSADDAPSTPDDATVYPDGAVIAQRKPTTRRRRRTAADAEAAPEAQAELPAPDAEQPADADAASEQDGARQEPTQRGRRRRSAGRRQGPPEPVAGDDIAAVVAQRVADAAPGERAASEVDDGERDRKLQDLVAALAGDDDTESPVDDGQRADAEDAGEGAEADQAQDDSDEDGDKGSRRRRRRRGGRRRRRGGSDDSADDDTDDEQDSDENRDATDESDDEQHDDDEQDADDTADASASEGDAEGEQGDGNRRRRRRRRRRGEDTSGADDDPSDVVVRVREPRGARAASDEVTGIEGSTRMEAKRQRRKEGRAAGRSRRPILSEAEFLSRRESVNRTMLIRQRDDYTQLAVLEDDVLVEHYVDRASATSLIGNIYVGRIQNVLPSMEAVFIDIGRGRNAVLYAGEVDWDSYGAVGDSKKVEQVFKSGQTVLVQVTKDPVGAKGARLTNHVSLPGRYVVYSPGGHLSGISRKLADTERHRLRDILGDLVSDEESVIVRTAAEGASEEELVRDVNRLKAQWEAIQKKVKQGSAPQLLYAEPDLTVRIVRDLFTEDFAKLVVSGNGSATDAYDNIEAYVDHVAPHLRDRLVKWDAESEGDLFSKYRIDEQIAKALERKVFLPSGGSLVIDRTEAMTVIDVNTGKFTGSGGNLEATVTSNNLEAAEEIVRQLRLRDIGGIIVVDFIDMVLPSNRELLLRRLVECLGRDRTRHQVAEVTSLGLVQMTRKKIGTGLAEAFTEQCECCGGRGYTRSEEPVESQAPADGGERRSGVSTSRRGGRRRSSKGDNN